VAEALGRLQIDLPTKARRATMMSIMGGNASVRSVASLVGVHPRALNRQLAAHGTTCRDLLQEVRVQIAHQLLADTDSADGGNRRKPRLRLIKRALSGHFVFAAGYLHRPGDERARPADIRRQR